MRLTFKKSIMHRLAIVHLGLAMNFAVVHTASVLKGKPRWRETGLNKQTTTIVLWFEITLASGGSNCCCTYEESHKSYVSCAP